MKTLAKVLLGAAIGAVVYISAIKLSKTKVYAEVNPIPEEDSEVQKKIKDAALKMTNWILEHKDDIQAVTLVITLAAAVIKLSSAVRDYNLSIFRNPDDPFSIPVTKEFNQFLQTIRDEGMHGKLAGRAGEFEIIPV